MEYPKIQSLWKREPNEKKSLIPGDYSEPEFGNIRRWRVDEKIDGTNIRISYVKNSFVPIMFDGRTSKAQIPTNLIKVLSSKFQNQTSYDLFEKVFPSADKVILFGEGYGPKIQSSGSNYRKEPGFMLFDVFIVGWWIKREDVVEIASKLEIDVVPSLGIMEECEIVEFVKSNPLSKCSYVPQRIEGVVCRSEPLVLFRNQKQVMWKLKCRDFK